MADVEPRVQPCAGFFGACGLTHLVRSLQDSLFPTDAERMRGSSCKLEGHDGE